MRKYIFLFFMLSGCATRGIDYSNARIVLIDENAVNSFIASIKHLSKAQGDSLLSEQNGKVYSNPFSPTLYLYFFVPRDSCAVSVALTSLDSIHSATIFQGVLNKGSYKIRFPNQDSVCCVFYFTVKSDTTRIRRIFYFGGL